MDFNATEGTPCPPAMERHFTAQEVGKLWKIDPSTVRRMFCDEEGVLKITRKRLRTKRPYVLLRIPASVLARVHQDRARGFRSEIERSRG